MRGRPHLIPALIAAIMLIIAIAPLAYAYYELLRWIVCCGAVFIAVMTYRWNKIWATCLFGLIAVLFNPLSPIHLTKQIWQPIDLTCALLFFVSIFLLRAPAKSG